METTSGIPDAKQQFICNRKEKTNFQKKLPKQTNNPSIVRGVLSPNEKTNQMGALFYGLLSIRPAS